MDTNSNTYTTKMNVGQNVKHDRCTLLDSMIQYDAIRTDSLKNEGKAQINCVSPTAGWIATTFLIRGRAFDNVIYPFIIVVVHATIYVLVQELYLKPNGYLFNENLQSFHTFVLNTVLSFLLVFRLNRAAGRYWYARQYWGDIVAKCRSSIGTIIVHGDHNIQHRDDAIRWIASFCITTMALLRNDKQLLYANFIGLLSKDEVLTLQQQCHPPMYSIDQTKYHLKQLFESNDNDATVCIAAAFSRISLLNGIEVELNTMIKSGGGLERIKGTPLPVVYVSHIRTLILISLLVYPWLFGPAWGYMTIPIVIVAAFAWLGLESTAVEVECPFGKDRDNALNMDGYVIALLATIRMQLQCQKDRDTTITTTSTTLTASV